MEILPIQVAQKKRRGGGSTLENRLRKIVRDVEALEKKEEELVAAIEKAMPAYDAKVRPVALRIVEAGKKLHRAGIEAWKRERPRPAVTRALHEMLEGNLMRLSEQFGYDDEQMIDELLDLGVSIGISPPKPRLLEDGKLDMESVPEEMKELIRAFDMDPEKLLNNEISEEEMEAKVESKFFGFDAEGGFFVDDWDSQQEGMHRSEEAHRERLEKVFRKLYLQLARILHPDKEKDPGRRAEKTEWMQRLTQAQQDRDFLGLLKLLQSNPFASPDDRFIPEKADRRMLRDYRELFEEQKAVLEARIQELEESFACRFFGPLITRQEGIDHQIGLAVRELKQVAAGIEDLARQFGFPGNLEPLLEEIGILSKRTKSARKQERMPSAGKGGRSRKGGKKRG